MKVIQKGGVMEARILLRGDGKAYLYVRLFDTQPLTTQAHIAPYAAFPSKVHEQIPHPHMSRQTALQTSPYWAHALQHSIRCLRKAPTLTRLARSAALPASLLRWVAVVI